MSNVFDDMGKGNIRSTVIMVLVLACVGAVAHFSERGTSPKAEEVEVGCGASEIRPPLKTDMSLNAFR